MEKVYKNNNILFKILPCLLIAMYAVMCLFGSYVCAADKEDVYEIQNMGTINISNPNNYYYLISMLKDSYGSYYVKLVISKSPIVNSRQFSASGSYFYEVTSEDKSEIKYSNMDSLGTLKEAVSQINTVLSKDFSDIPKSPYLIGNYAQLPRGERYAASAQICNYDVKNRSGEVVFQSSVKFISPEIQNKDKISKLDFDSMAIFLNDYDSKERLYLHRLEVATTVDLGDGNTVYYYNDKVFGLDFFTSYYNNDPDHPGYTIPKYQFELENNKIYYFLLSSSATSLDHSYNLIDYTKIENAYDGFGVSTSDSFTYEQLQQEQQKKQNDQLEENNKTNKNIFETIKEMLSYLNPFSDNFILLKLWDFLGTLISYINPFSDNFLGKKIVELIGNLLKSLFVPSDEYFNNFFSDLKQWFSDRFGLLFYPFELIIDILNRITNINLSEPKFNIPEIKEPSTGKILFKAQNYNFNDLLDTNEFKIMHDIYFVIVDAIIIFALANLIKSKLKEVETE